jgi:hypothetical protein
MARHCVIAVGNRVAPTSDCGSDVDVLVAKEDLIGLLAPGGFGVRREA